MYHPRSLVDIDGVILNQEGLSYHIKKNFIVKYFTGKGIRTGFAPLDHINVCELAEQRVLPIYILFSALFFLFSSFVIAIFVLFSGEGGTVNTSFTGTQMFIIGFPFIIGAFLWLAWLLWFKTVVNVYSSGQAFLTLTFPRRDDAIHFLDHYHQLTSGVHLQTPSRPMRPVQQNQMPPQPPPQF